MPDPSKNLADRSIVHTAAFWSYLVASMPLAFVGAAAVWAATRRIDPKRRWLHKYTSAWAGHYVRYNPMWRLDIRGTENVDPDRAYIFAVNHQSAGDVPVVFALGLDFKFVSKDANFKIPFLGWTMSMNRYVRLVRGNAMSGAAMLSECLRWLRDDVSILMFPEGTRSKDGELLPFHHGAFTLARRAKVDVVPIVVDGTRHALPASAVLNRGVAPIRVQVGRPIGWAQFGDARRLSDEVRSRMSAMLADLRDEARGGGPRALSSVPAPAERRETRVPAWGARARGA